MTLSAVAQLSAHHSSISISPEVITHSTPLIVNADLYSAFISNVTSYQSQLALCAGSCERKVVNFRAFKASIDLTCQQYCSVAPHTFTTHTSIIRMVTVV